MSALNRYVVRSAFTEKGGRLRFNIYSDCSR